VNDCLNLFSNTTVSENQWHHIAYTHSSGTWKVYIDGVLDSQDTVSFFPDNTKPLHIGTDGMLTSSRFYEGAMDELRIHNRALSGAEIQELYSNDSTAAGSLESYCADGAWVEHSVLQGEGYCVGMGASNEVDRTVIEEASSATHCGGYYKTNLYTDNQDKVVGVYISNGNCRADVEDFPIPPSGSLENHCIGYGGTGNYKWMYHKDIQPFGGYGTLGIVCEMPIQSSTSSDDTESNSLERPVLTLVQKGLNIKASWSAMQGAQGYRLYYAEYPNRGASGVIDMGNQTSLSIDLWDGAAYYINIEAYNSEGSSELSQTEYFILQSEESELLTPSLSLIEDGLRITMVWTEVSNATGYKIHYATYPDRSESGVLDIGNSTSFSVELWDRAAFFVNVEAYNEDRNSNLSNTVDFILSERDILPEPEPEPEPEPGLDLNGTWEGTAVSSKNNCSASFSGNVIQNNNTLSGEGDISGNCLSQTFHGTIDGSISGDQVTFGVASSNGQAVTFEGVVQGSRSASGTYTWASIGDQGTWTMQISNTPISVR